MHDNIILATDSYKLCHWQQYPKNTEYVYSYFESRKGAAYPVTTFFGLQYILKRYMTGKVVTMEHIYEAARLAEVHFGQKELFNLDGWLKIVRDHDGRLPLRIKAVPEGLSIPTGNVLMTVENTDPDFFWLTNAVESLLTHVWYPSTVATHSRTTKAMLREFLELTGGDPGGLPFMLHDFGYRGATTHEAAAMGGAGHLVNFVGTDTLPAMLLAKEYYDADYKSLAFSVPATEHSVMTARGEDGEFDVVAQLLDEYPKGILSVVADSYDIYRFVDTIGTRFKDQILARDGVFVVRPDSITPQHDTPEKLVAILVGKLFNHFGGTTNDGGYRVLNEKVRVLWGDGITREGIHKILDTLEAFGFAAENMVFGMGGGLLQKGLDRDTQRFAFKCSAACQGGQWVDIQKKPLDESKASKKGRMKLVRHGHGAMTVPEDHPGEDIMQTVFENGELVREYTFDEVRENAALRPIVVTTR